MIQFIFRTWFTGALYLLAAVGYSFLAVLWAIRFMQTKKTWAVSIGAAFVCMAAAVVYLFVPLGPPKGPAIELTVEKGSSLKSIGRTLVRRGVVPSSTAFVLWMKLTGRESRVQAGLFVVYKGEGIAAVSRELLHATPVETTLTIPEGLTIEQTAGVVARAFHADSSEFVRECSDTGLLHENGIGAPTCEGYLFPDTYRFPPDAKPRDMVRRMVAHFKDMTAALPAPAARPAGAALSSNDYIVLASIIEREAQVAPERRHISGVFHNRLDKRMPLGADPTVRYALRKFNGPLLASELAMDSPYNTRTHTGLPPGPICSPGLASLIAAMDPEETKDLYFVAKWDGSGTHEFSTTNEEHTRKKNEIRRMNELRKVNLGTTMKENGWGARQHSPRPR